MKLFSVYSMYIFTNLIFFIKEAVGIRYSAVGK